MRAARSGAPFLFMAAAAAAQPVPQASASELALSAGLVHRRLVERADGGRRLVTESGPLLRMGAAARREFAGGGALAVDAAVTAGELDYRGQTQSGAPLETRSGHRDLALGLAWRALPAAARGEGWLVLRALQQRRQIASTPRAGGLRETSRLLLPGLRWTNEFAAAGWRWSPSVELRASVHHRLDVGFGGVFDGAALEGGRRRELLLALDAAPAASPWRLGVAWSHARQSASPLQPLARGGAVVGTVRQPRVASDDVTLRITRAF